jgi:putative pyruvate formate lyase activating enzyme
LASYNLMPLKTLEERAEEAISSLESCQICPRHCLINRLKGELGFCRCERQVRVHSYAPHFGEELPLVGVHGSGTIFFSGCNLSCIFCQNFEISQLDHGSKVSAKSLAMMMKSLQNLGCHKHKLRHTLTLCSPYSRGPYSSKSIGPDRSPGLQQRRLRFR